jgi:hypothetical protein
MELNGAGIGVGIVRALGATETMVPVRGTPVAVPDDGADPVLDALVPDVPDVPDVPEVAPIPPVLPEFCTVVPDAPLVPVDAALPPTPPILPEFWMVAPDEPDGAP